ncbi:hypothetical protein DQ04_19181010, partial [Trypanosoma grayi]|uniref:hypothetical protein n=1 Tax=Trypanosoma grayi TaxID=71804 RepID=UPI0004F49D43
MELWVSDETTQCPSSQGPLPGAAVSPGLDGALGTNATCPGDGTKKPPCAEAVGTGGDGELKDHTAVGQKVCAPLHRGVDSVAEDCQQNEELIPQKDDSRSGEQTSMNKEACEEALGNSTCTPSSLKPGHHTQSQSNLGATSGGGGGIVNGVQTGAGGPAGAPGTPGAGGIPGAKDTALEKGIVGVDGKSLADCPAEGGGRMECSSNRATPKAQVQINEPGERLDSGGTLDKSGGKKITQSDKGLREDTQSEGNDEPVHAASADGECKNGKLEGKNMDCKQLDKDRSTQPGQREKDVLQTKNTQAPEVNPKLDSPLGAKDEAKNAATTSTAPPSPDAERSANDHPNVEPVESTPQAAVDQSDAVQSQTSPTSTSTSATEATSSSQPSSSPSTDKGQDTKAVDSS